MVHRCAAVSGSCKCAQPLASSLTSPPCSTVSPGTGSDTSTPAEISSKDDLVSTEPRITLVSTYKEVEAAVQTLSRHPTLVLDCEGRDLCMPNGVLSIISLADPMASDIHLFDILALADKQNPSLSSLFSILRDKLVTKLVWDGRHRFMEIADKYGVIIDGIVDVQVVEVMLRPEHDLYGSMRAKHTVDYFKKSSIVMDHYASDPSLLDGIHRIMGMEYCAAAVGLHKEIAGKDRMFIHFRIP